MVLREARDGAVLTLTLDRPDVRNALDAELTQALVRALTRAADDPDVRAVLLTGAPPAFSAGGDVRAMLERRGDALATKRYHQENLVPLIRAALGLPKPLVAAVNGDTMGAGLSLAAAADVTVASRDARFGVLFARMALVPDTGATWLLPRLVGLKAAKRLALSADVVDAGEAHQLGLVDEVVDDAVARGREVAARFAEGPTRAYGLIKQALVAGSDAALDEALANEANLQGLAFTLDDHAEAVDAFLEKRKPTFRGT